MIDRTSEPRPAPGSEAGFSLIETLIASVLLLMVVIGVLPLFSRSMLNNAQGSDAIRQTNAAVDRAEPFLELPFGNDALTLPLGGGTEVVNTDSWLLEGNLWVPDPSTYPNDEVQMTRTTTIEQFGISDLEEGDQVFDTPLDGNAATASVQVKRIRMDVAATRSLGAPAYRVTVLKTY